jgi:membrane protein YdbS with pleckstrin-like domain
MYSPLKSLVVRLLKVPSAAPEPPAGTYASVQVFRASPRYLTYRLILFYIGVVVVFTALSIGLIASLIAEEYVATAIIVAVLPVLFLIAFTRWFVVRIDYELRHYIVTDRSLRVREGALIVREMTLTYANVQNLRIVQGPLQRAFGISDLLVDTAGGGATRKNESGAGSGHQFKLAGIENAREVRDLVLSYVRGFNRGSGLGDLDDVEHERSSSAHSKLPASGELVAALRAVHEAATKLRHAAGREVGS